MNRVILMALLIAPLFTAGIALGGIQNANAGVPQVDVEVPVDIKPQSCPNPLNVNSQGVLPVAIVGTDSILVQDIDPDSITLQGVQPLRSELEDVATPFEPFVGKGDALDCTAEGPDGFVDLTFKFDTQAIVAAWDEPIDGEVIVLILEGQFKDETPLIGEDVVIIISKN